MSKWSSFEQDQEYTEDWRQYLESAEMDESKLFKGGKPSGEIPEPEEGGAGTPAPERTPAPAQAAGAQPQGKLAQAKAGAQKGAAGAEKARQAATGAWDWIANFLGGNVKDKDYSHLNMPTPDIPTAKGAEPEGEESAEEDAATTQKKREEEEAWKQHREEPGAGEQQKTDGAQEEEPKDKKKTISRVPDSALNESQTYDRWKVLSGIKKKVI